MSLVLITVDCLRADHVGWLGYQRPTTPFLDSLAGESIAFTCAIAAGTPTYYSFPAMVASRPPLALGRDLIGLAPGEPNLAATLRDGGYKTAAFLAANPYLSARFGYDGGFEVFEDSLASCSGEPEPLVKAGVLSGFCSRANSAVARTSHRLGALGTIYDEMYFRYGQRVAASQAESFESLRRFPSAEVIVDQACDWLSHAGKAPFFLWLHLMDPHAPYYPCGQALQWMGSDNCDAAEARWLNSYWNRGDIGPQRLRSRRQDVIALYDAGIRWADFQISRLVAYLRSHEMWENCAFAVTADHGEEFLEHGGRYHAPEKLTEELIRVPLVLRVPGMNALSVAAPFSLVHGAPTLLDALDHPVPAEFRGRSFWPSLTKGRRWQEAVITECVRGCTNPFHPESRIGERVVSVREERYKLIMDLGFRSEQMFDLEADPEELHPVAAEVERPARRRLLQAAYRHLETNLKARNEDDRLAAQLQDARWEWSRSTEPAYA